MRCATMTAMRIDHVSYAAEPDGMRATAERLAQRLGVQAFDGGVHPRFGTRNMILPLAEERYLEVVEVLDHPASDKAPFGQAVRARSAQGGGWLAWVVRVDDLAPIEERLGRPAVSGNRTTPEGVELTWRQIGIKGTMADPQLPFFVKWDDTTHHPSTLAGTRTRLEGLQLHGDLERIREWLGLQPGSDSGWEADVRFEIVAAEPPALDHVVFDTPEGAVTV